MRLAYVGAPVFGAVLFFYWIVSQDGIVTQDEIEDLRTQFPGNSGDIDMLEDILRDSGALPGVGGAGSGESDFPSMVPSDMPSSVPSDFPSNAPSDMPSTVPSDEPSSIPSDVPSSIPSDVPSSVPSDIPSSVPSDVPSSIPSDAPSSVPSDVPSSLPSDVPSSVPSVAPNHVLQSDYPSLIPVSWPTPDDEVGGEGDLDLDETDGTCLEDGGYEIVAVSEDSKPDGPESYFEHRRGSPFVYNYELYHSSDSEEGVLDLIQAIERYLLDKALAGYCLDTTGVESSPTLSSRPLDFPSGTCGDGCDSVFGWMTPNAFADVDEATMCKVKQLVFDTMSAGELESIPGVEFVKYREVSVFPCFVEIGGFNGNSASTQGSTLDGRSRRQSSSARAAITSSAAAGVVALACCAMYVLRKRRSSSPSPAMSATAESFLGDSVRSIV